MNFLRKKLSPLTILIPSKPLYMFSSRICISRPLLLKNSDRISALDTLEVFFCWIPSTNFPKDMATQPQAASTVCQNPVYIIHHGRFTWNIIMEVWKIIFLSKWAIYRFHVNLPGCISLQPTAQPPFLERPPRRRAVHPRRESDPILASIKTRKISEKFQQNHSILAYTNCEEFPMKFPRSLNSPQLWRISHLLSNCCEMVGFFFREVKGATWKKLSKRVNLQLAMEIPSLHHHEGRSPSVKLEIWRSGNSQGSRNMAGLSPGPTKVLSV